MNTGSAIQWAIKWAEPGTEDLQNDDKMLFCLKKTTTTKMHSLIGLQQMLEL